MSLGPCLWHQHGWSGWALQVPCWALALRILFCNLSVDVISGPDVACTTGQKDSTFLYLPLLGSCHLLSGNAEGHATARWGVGDMFIVCILSCLLICLSCCTLGSLAESLLKVLLAAVKSFPLPAACTPACHGQLWKWLCPRGWCLCQAICHGLVCGLCVGDPWVCHMLCTFLARREPVFGTPRANCCTSRANNIRTHMQKILLVAVICIVMSAHLCGV